MMEIDMPVSSSQKPSGVVAADNGSGGMQKFIKDWMLCNGIMYQCSRCYVPISRVFKCRISVASFDIAVSAISADWKMAKRIASYRVCARLLALGALTFDQLPSKFHNVCRVRTITCRQYLYSSLTLFSKRQ
ncbi:hypothetical protein TTRE_0000971501 [Trichuris trichiura]|uniref:Uncharacterized protein n=1 Tax=Trichuris trichiura TaxID=36087 RepID=A0A077ZLS6_TRITR|nr:hypothetical protein TTRE_0000971501 [Trichuris trichiura]